MKWMYPAARFRAAIVLLLAMLASCGGSEPPAASPSQEESSAKESAPRRKKQQLTVSGQLGSLDEGKVDATFNRLMPQFGSCLSQASSRVEFIGGHVKFFVRISLDGAAKWAYLSESTIGDRDAERCMLNAAKAVRWPPPVEGEGQAQKAFDFDPSPEVRDAVPWGADRITKALVGARAKLGQCTHGAPGRYRATVYVQTDGTPLSAGIAPPNERGEVNAVDCIVEVIRSMKFPSPGSWPAKVMFDVD
jgi:hypothetical protein